MDDFDLNDDDELFSEITDSDYEGLTSDEAGVGEPASQRNILFSASTRKFAITWALGSIVNQTLTQGVEQALIFDMLDKLSGGELSQKLKFKKLERECFAAIKLASFIKQLSETTPASEEFIAQNAHLYMRSLVELVEFKAQRFEREYTEQCEALGEPNQLEPMRDGKLTTDSEYEVEMSRYVNLTLREKNKST